MVYSALKQYVINVKWGASVPIRIYFIILSQSENMMGNLSKICVYVVVQLIILKMYIHARC